MIINIKSVLRVVLIPIINIKMVLRMILTFIINCLKFGHLSNAWAPMQYAYHKNAWKINFGTVIEGAVSKKWPVSEL